MTRIFFMAIIIITIFGMLLDTGAADPLMRTPYKYGLLLDKCTLDGKPLKKERPGDWGYYITISHEVVFGSDVDSRWLRIVFQYFKKTNEVEFTLYSSPFSRMGKWDELVTFRRQIKNDKTDFTQSSTWDVITFENKNIDISFKFFISKAR